MRTGLLVLVAVLVAGCGSSTPPYAPGVRVEVALIDGAVQPPVFRWDAPVAARVTVQRGRTTVWEVADGDSQASDGGTQRGPIPSPLTYGESYDRHLGPRPHVVVQPAALSPRTVYRVTVVGYDGAVYEGRFSVNERVEVR